MVISTQISSFQRERLSDLVPRFQDTALFHLKPLQGQRPSRTHLEQFKRDWQSSCCGSAVINLTSIHEVAGSIPGSTQWVKDLFVATSCGVGGQLHSDSTPSLGTSTCRGYSPKKTNENKNEKKRLAIPRKCQVFSSWLPEESAHPSEHPSTEK